MKIAIASGKGGTGKTTLAVNLTQALADQGVPVQYLDCDVEEPNGHLFLKPQIHGMQAAGITVPVVDETRCTACRQCADACQYHAIAMLKTALVFPELCHGCGGCTLACPIGAILERERPIGVVETGLSSRPGTGHAARFSQGRLNVGEPMSPPLIRAVKRSVRAGACAILDAPPGTSCPVVTTVRDADYVLLVTEPTPFGLNDLQLAVQMLRQLGRRHGVVVNRSDSGDRRVADYCAAEAIPILLEIPNDRRVAECYSCGQLVLETLPTWRTMLLDLWKRMEDDRCR